MFYLSDANFRREMKRVKAINASNERKQKLRQERNKYKPFHIFITSIKTSNKILIAAIIAIIWFTMSSMYIQYSTGMEVSSTLTTLWFTFWTVEIVSLAGIKISKVVKDTFPSDDNDDNHVETQENNDVYG